MTEGGTTRKRKRPSAKEARERMARAVGSQAPMSRAEEATEEPTEQASPKARKTPSPARTSGKRGGGEAGAVRGGGDPGRGRDPAPRLVRLSVDVPADQHRRLRVMAAESGATGMAVVRALLAEMEGDPELTARVRDRLAEFGR